MPFAALLGRIVSLPVWRFGPPGAFLAVDASAAVPAAPTLLLPRSEVPNDAVEGTPLDVFVYLDSEDRPIATLRRPAVLLGEIAFLRVTDVNRFGAFVDWGLPKELLVPYAEQTRDVHVGEQHPIALYVDDTGRLAGTMRVSERLRAEGSFELDQWVSGEAWRTEPGIGLFVIVERTCVGVLPEGEPHALERGEPARFRVTSVLPDGKFELSLRGHAHEELDDDASHILETLGLPELPKVGDKSSPDEIRAWFGLSKKAFKRGVGRLLKRRAVRLDEGGFLVRVKETKRP